MYGKKESLAYNELFISLSLTISLCVSLLSLPLPLSIHFISNRHYWHDRGIMASPALWIQTENEWHIISVSGSPQPVSSALFCQRVITPVSERTRFPPVPPPPSPLPIFSLVHESLFSLCCPSAPSDSNTGAALPIRPPQTAKLHPKTPFALRVITVSLSLFGEREATI